MSEDKVPQSAEQKRCAAFTAFLNNRNDLSESLYLSAVGEMRSSGQEDIHLVQSFHTLARIYMSSNRFTEAESYLQQGLAVCEHLEPPEGYMLSLLYTQLGELYYRQNRFREAELALVHSLMLCEQAMGAENCFLDYGLEYYERVLRATGREREAEAVAERQERVKGNGYREREI